MAMVRIAGGLATALALSIPTAASAEQWRIDFQATVTDIIENGGWPWWSLSDPTEQLIFNPSLVIRSVCSLGLVHGHPEPTNAGGSE